MCRISSSSADRYAEEDGRRKVRKEAEKEKADVNSRIRPCSHDVSATPFSFAQTLCIVSWQSYAVESARSYGNRHLPRTGKELRSNRTYLPRTGSHRLYATRDDPIRSTWYCLDLMPAGQTVVGRSDGLRGAFSRSLMVL